MWFILRNHSKSSEAAVEIDAELRDMTQLVELRNDPAHGAGLLFVSYRFYYFLLTVESVYSHVFKRPIYLAAYLGDLSEKTLTLVTQSTMVRNAWAVCCESAAQNAGFSPNERVLEVIFLFFCWGSITICVCRSILFGLRRSRPL